MSKHIFGLPYMETFRGFWMETKFELKRSKNIADPKWKHFVSVYFDYEIHEKNADIDIVYKIIRTEFLELMTKHFGAQDLHWNIRWNDEGADIRFDNASDAAQFTMCHIKSCKFKPLGRYYSHKTKCTYTGIRGH